MAEFHKPVLLNKAIDYLQVKPGESYIDATVGGGGHSQRILELGGRVLGIDCDPEAIKAARKYLSSACPTLYRSGTGSNTSWRLAQGNFSQLEEIAGQYGFKQVAGIIFDLGISNYQLEMPGRGFSFKLEGNLDMRMDPRLTVTAADLVNGLNKGELNELFFKLGEEYGSRKIAEAICCARRIEPITKTTQLAKIIVGVKSKSKFGRIHPATKCFQALRIAVNSEIENLEKALPQVARLLKKEGRLVVISFHSLEDRVVKQFLQESFKKGEMNIITQKPVTPSFAEVRENPRCRSAKLRVGEKV